MQSLVASLERLSKAADTMANTAATFPQTIDANRSAQQLVQSVDRVSKAVALMAEQTACFPATLDGNESAQTLIASLDRMSTATVILADAAAVFSQATADGSWPIAQIMILGAILIAVLILIVKFVPSHKHRATLRQHVPQHRNEGV